MPVFCLNIISVNYVVKGLIDNKSALVQLFGLTKLLDATLMINVLWGSILTHEEQIPSEQFSWDEFMDKWLIDKIIHFFDNFDGV